MIKIELVKFEAQDVITVSGGVIEAPAKQWDGNHDPNCASAINYKAGDTHKPGYNGMPNAAYHDGRGWFDCECGCHW